MLELALSSEQYLDPMAVTHQGKAIYFVRKWNDTLDEFEYFYNVLNPEITSINDSLDWEGYQPLTFSKKKSLAGFNMLRVEEEVVFEGFFSVLSDQKYVYLFRSSGNRVYVNRFMMVEVANSRMNGNKSNQLQTAWEVRYRRSAKPDTPANGKDSQSFINMENEPFIEPQYIIPFAGNTADFEIANGYFTVDLVPTNEDGIMRWQFFVVNNFDKKLNTYSIERTEDGWFLFNQNNYDKAKNAVVPDHVISTNIKESSVTLDLAILGPPTSTVYAKQEPVAINGEDQIKLRNSYRLKLMFQSSDANAKNYLSNLDFAVTAKGTLAFIAPKQGDVALNFEAGKIKPIEYSLSFDNSLIKIPDTINLGNSFVQQLWVYPRDTGLRRNFLLGSDNAGQNKDMAPSLWIENRTKIGFGFGDGTNFFKGETVDGVLQLNNWSNVIAVFDGTNYAIYINGSQVVVNNSSFSGKTPTSTFLNALGAGGIKGNLEYLLGYIDEVRVWNNSKELANAMKYLYDEIPESVASGMTDLLAYWRLDEGTGTKVSNLSGGGTVSDGKLEGPEWISAHAPIKSAFKELTYIDEDTLLSLAVGVIDPSAQIPLFSNFGNVKPGSRPLIYDSADGLLHLYYEGNEERYYVAHYDSSSARTQFQFPWTADSISNESDQRNVFYFTSRQPGEAANNALITITKESNSYLCTVTIDDKLGTKEVWKGVPIRISSLINILGGAAFDEPGKYNVSANEQTYYDYSGNRKVGYAAYGVDENKSQLIFIGSEINDNFFEKIESKIDQSLITSKLVFSVGGGTNNFIKTFKNLPILASDYVNTLRGLSTSYDYSSVKNQLISDSLIYSLPAGNNYILVLVPDNKVRNVSFTIDQATDGNSKHCILTVDLELNSTKIQAEWKNISRSSKAFIEAIKSSATGKEKQVSDLLFFIPYAESENVLDGIVVQPESLLAVIKLFDVYQEGKNGNIGKFNCVLGNIQGTTVNKKKQILTSGSLLFLPYSLSQSNNGFPEVIDFGKENEITPSVAVAGKDGGWLAESPRKAVEIPINGGLEVLLDNKLKAPLDIKGDLTMEGWVNTVSLYNSNDTKPNLPDYPRIIHANPTDDDNGSRYMMGVSPSFALQFVSKVSVIKSDDIQPAALKLFKESNYTIQFYIKADLNSFLKSNFIYQREDKGTVSKELLTLVPDGTLTYTLNFSDDTSLSVVSVKKIQNEVWTMVTITRTGSEVKLYLNGELDKEEKTASPSSYASNTITLGNNLETVCLEMELNQFTIWQRALDGNEVLNRYQQILQLDAEGLILLWGLNVQNEKNSIPNTAQVSGSIYDTEVNGNTFWDYPGVFYHAFGASRDLAMITESAIIPEQTWTHLACVYFMNYGITTGGVANTFANCGNDKSFDVPEAFTIESWVYQDTITTDRKQVIFSKYGKEANNQSFEFGLDSQNHPYLSVRVSGQKNVEEKERHFTILSNAKIEPNQAYFIAATFVIEEIDEEVKTLKVLNPKSFQKLLQVKENEIEYVVKGQIIINDKVQDVFESSSIKDSIELTQSNIEVNIGRTSPDGDEADFSYFHGIISNLSFWQIRLDASTIVSHFRTRKNLAGSEGLVSIWNFIQQEGRVAFDDQNDNNAILTESNAWTIFPYSAEMKIYINGIEMPALETSFATLGGYGVEQVRFGNMLNENNSLVNTYKGKFDEIRIWDQVRTQEQITDNMFGYLQGKEDHLNAYWQFSVGSGDTVVDITGHGNNATFTADTSGNMPKWIDSDAPVNNEAPQVTNAIGGIITPYSKLIKEGTAVVEYADVQYDYYGKLFSVIKRCYIYLNNKNVLETLTGFKIGDLQQIYLGQVQSEPTIMGYIEGAPPIPSENLTRPFYLDPTKPSYLAYYDSSSVKLTRDKNLSVSYSSTREDGRQVAFGIKGGAEFESKEFVLLSAAGFGTITSAVKVAGAIGAALEISWSDSETSGKGLASKINHANENHMYNCGDWEVPNSDGSYYLKTKERRFIPNNEGVALVKSATADVYALFLKSTGALVSFSVVPNPDIPEDINYIYFPISNDYVKNGSLDGRLGLQDDPDASGTSYFKPIEAYSLKRRIDNENSKVAAYYHQFEAANRAKSQNNNLQDVIDENNLYNWDNDKFKKDIMNTYIWTAAGGLYSESNGYASILQETHSGSYNFNWNLGLYGSLFIATKFGGVKFEANLMGGTNWTVNVHKAKEEVAQIKLDIAADPDGFLGKYLGADALPAYSPQPEPGKVDSYRFNSYYLASDNRNIDDLFSKVIDQNWLKNSGDPRAKALLEAQAQPNNGAWRVMHRVTFVSRIPPKFQNFPNESQAPPLEVPDNLAGNNLLLTMVKARMPQGDSTPELIGKLVRDIILIELTSTIPWWSEFLKKADVYNSEENLTLTNLINDTIDYMVRYYETK